MQPRGEEEEAGMRKFSKKSLLEERETRNDRTDRSRLPLWNLKKHLGDFVVVVVVVDLLIDVDYWTTTNRIVVVVVDPSNRKKRRSLVVAGVVAVVAVEEKD